MKKTATLLAILMSCIFSFLKAQTGERIAITLTTGSDDVRPRSTVKFKVNFTDGTSSEEFTIVPDAGSVSTGIPRDSRKTFNADLGRQVDINAIQSFTIRHDGSPKNIFDTYDNWDLQGLEIKLANRMGIRTWFYGLYNSTDRTFVQRFTGDNRQLIVNKRVY